MTTECRIQELISKHISPLISIMYQQEEQIRDHMNQILQKTNHLGMMLLPRIRSLLLSRYCL